MAKYGSFKSNCVIVYTGHTNCDLAHLGGGVRYYQFVSATTTTVFRKKLDTVNFTTYMLDKY